MVIRQTPSLHEGLISGMGVAPRSERRGFFSHVATRAIRIAAIVLLLVGGLSAAPAKVLAAEEAAGQRPCFTFSTFQSEGMRVLFERILTEAYDRLGYDVVIEGFPAERALVMSDQGDVDGEAGRVPVIESQCWNLIRVPTPLCANRVVAFTRQPDFNARDGWRSLWQYRLGTVIGYKFIEKKIKRLNAEFFSSYRTLFTALENDRVDVAVSMYLEALPTIRNMELNDVRAYDPPLASKLMHHYLHKKHADFVPEIDRVLRQMQQSGRLDAIRRELEAEYERR